MAFATVPLVLLIVFAAVFARWGRSRACVASRRVWAVVAMAGVLVWVAGGLVARLLDAVANVGLASPVVRAEPRPFTQFLAGAAVWGLAGALARWEEARRLLVGVLAGTAVFVPVVAMVAALEVSRQTGENPATVFGWLVLQLALWGVNVFVICLAWVFGAGLDLLSAPVVTTLGLGMMPFEPVMFVAAASEIPVLWLLLLAMTSWAGVYGWRRPPSTTARQFRDRALLFGG